MNECKRSRATTRTRFIYIYTHNVKYEGRSMESENILFVFIYKSIGYAYWSPLSISIEIKGNLCHKEPEILFIMLYILKVLGCNALYVYFNICFILNLSS
jgi:hypothetical protein